MLRKGVHLQLKTERTADIIRQFLALPLRDWRNVGLAVDDRTVAELLDHGGLDNEVRNAIELGVPAITAYQMATINNAVHWQVSDLHGMLAPGRYADVLLVSDLEQVTIDRVFANGRLVAERGQLTAPLTGAPVDPSLRNTVTLSRALRAADFEVQAPPGRRDVQAYVLPPRYFSRELGPITKTLQVRDGRVQRDLSRGITKYSIVERYGKGMTHRHVVLGARVRSGRHRVDGQSRSPQPRRDRRHRRRHGGRGQSVRGHRGRLRHRQGRQGPRRARPADWRADERRRACSRGGEDQGRWTGSSRSSIRSRHSPSIRPTASPS